MACRKMNEDFAYALNTESGCNIFMTSNTSNDVIRCHHGCTNTEKNEKAPKKITLLGFFIDLIF